ncbi:MAG: hypothetical protein KDI19_16260, partial [Pseudomonadales bacterium]|nr:hypothetical protein [Pseudomonadales bacterium]
PASLAEAIEDFSGYELVLIDTAGINQRDVRLADHLQALTSVPNLQNYLVISATSELTLTEEVVDAFHRIPLAGAIVTKVDEATTLGPVISGAIRHNLPIHYVCNGQAVPQDLGIARKSEIARLCKKLVLEAGVRRHAASRQARG